MKKSSLSVPLASSFITVFLQNVAYNHRWVVIVELGTNFGKTEMHKAVDCKETAS